MPDPADQGLEDLVGAQGRRDLLKDVEQQIAGPQRILGLAEIAAQAQIGVDAGPQLAEVHRARHGVLRSRLERLRHSLGSAVRY